MIVDFSWVLFVGKTLLGFTEKEVGRMTLTKWNALFTHYKRFYNFRINKCVFGFQEENPEEWIKD